MWVEVDKVIEVVRGSGTAIQWGHGFSPPAADTERVGLILVEDCCSMRRGYW